ncbi:MAG: hypothetical protein KKI02_11855, partial [Planctomycetes bacterium]|nr:hypothetical protein [Planctomycetota bacterium]
MDGDGEPDYCEVMHAWWDYTLPGTSIPSGSTPSPWATPDGEVVWTGFYGDKNIAGPRYYNLGGTTVPPTSVGARILGQQLDDHFGTSVGSDGTWLYISAPARTALAEDVPALNNATVPGDREHSGVVYRLRTNVHLPGQPNLAQ